MIKQFSPGDITIRPFTTFKNWHVQSVDQSGLDDYGYSTYYKNFLEINEGIKLTNAFYPSESVYYNSGSEPVNSSGKYSRNVYSLTNAMFYKNKDNPFQIFGVEKYGVDSSTGNKESRKINDRILTVSLNHNSWGEKIKPYTVKIVDNSNPHETYKIYDDGFTNLYITGSHFSQENKIGAIKNLGPRSYFDEESVQYYVTYNDGTVDFIDGATAKEYKDMGMSVSFTSQSMSWKVDDSYARDYFQPENEHFGESVSTWYKYIAVGSTLDKYSLSTARQGYVALFKYDESIGHHRFIKKFYCPFTQESLAQEFSSNNSFLFSIENNNFLMLEQAYNSGSYFEDSFGYSISVRDDFLAVGSPSGSLCTATASYPGFVYVYDKDKGGIDNWGVVNILQGSANGDRFGQSVAIADDILVVGAPNFSGSGAAYVFRKKQYFSGDCNEANTSSFWQTISTEKEICSCSINHTGSVPYFVSGNYSWEYESTLTSSVLSIGDNFGWSVAVDSGSVLIGTNKLGKGYACLFTSSLYSSSYGECATASWHQYKLFKANTGYGDLDTSSPLYVHDITSTAITTDGYGKSVAISNINALIGCPQDKAFIPYYGYSGPPTILGAAYFYQNSPICGTSSFHLINKSFGNREYQTNNNFAKSVAIEGNIAAVTSWGDRLGRTVDYVSGSFVLEDYSYYASSSQDPLGVLGRVTIYNFDDINDKWRLTGNIRRNKEKNCPANLYGYSLSISSDFITVGAPVVNYASGSNISSILDQTIQISSSFSGNYSGSVYVYNLNKYVENPYIGNVFYKNGYFVLTETGSNYYNIFNKTGSYGFDMTYQGTHTIYEHEYLVSINPGEFNYSTNPSFIEPQLLEFDVNGDGKFDFLDLDLIMRYLKKKKFFEEFVFDDNGIVLNQDSIYDDSWWNDDVLLSESEDVLLLERNDYEYALSASLNPFTKPAYDYIEKNLVQTGLLDIDGNGLINVHDGYILSLYYFSTLTPGSLETFLSPTSSRKYVKDIKEYLNRYCRKDNFQVKQDYLSYQAMSSFDPTGSYLAPFITTVGLYNNSQLVAVGKLGRPIKNLIDWPVNIVVRFDT